MTRLINMNPWRGAILLLACLGGCMRAPSLNAPNFRPGKIASAAMDQLDSDDDGFLTVAELESAPGFREGLRTIDKDKDQKITESEIEERIDALVTSKKACESVLCQFKLPGNKPLVGAEITFDPEPSMSDAIASATGTTDEAGRVELTCSVMPWGVQPGFYRVRVSKKDGGTETIDEKYNSSTVLGAEVSGLSLGHELGCYFFTLE